MLDYRRCKFLLTLPIILVLCLSENMLLAQELSIDTIVIEDSRIPLDYIRLEDDSNLKSKLGQSAGLYLRTATPGQSSTATLMGSSASQIPIVWNDIPINNRMVGVMDFSLLPNFFFQKSYLSHTSVGSSTSIGSTIHLEDRNFDTGVYGSFTTLNNFEMGVQLNLDQKGAEHRVKLYGLDANNDYNVNVNGIDYRALNNENQFFAAIYDNTFRFKTWKISTSTWLQQMNRKIPNSMNSQAFSKQYDKNARIQVQAEKHITQYQKIYIQGAYLYDEILFQNGFIDDLGVVDQKIGRLKHQYHKKNIKIENEYLHTYAAANHPEYRGEEGIQNEIQTDHFLQFQTNRLGKTTAGITNIWNNGNYVVNPYLTWALTQDVLNFHLKMAKNSRFPSLNDLYWAQGGNLDLLPETSYNIYGDITITRENDFLKIGLFYKNVDQWIQWLPDDNNVWRASNQLKVISKGFSVEGNYQFKETILKGWLLFGSYQYSSTKNRDELSPTFGKQLIYHPLHQAKANLTIPGKDWSVKISNQFCSERFTTSDNSSSLEGYLTHDIILTKNIGKNKDKMQLFVAVRNITNQNYQLSSGFYQPGIHGDIKIKIKLHE